MSASDNERDARTIYDGLVFRVERRGELLPDGRVAPRDVVVHNGGAAVLALDENGRVPLVRQYRIATNGPMLEIPAGKLDTPDENPLKAAMRELREECGLIAADVRHLSSCYATPGYCTEVIHLYLATGLTACETEWDDTEFLQIEWVPFTELAAMVADGRVNDMKTALAVSLARGFILQA